MSWLSDVIAGGGEGLIKGIGETAKDIRAAITGKSVVDPNKQAEIELKLQEMEQKALEYSFLLQKSQADINLEEAKNPNLFVSGWRPSVGWVCSLSFFANFFVIPLGCWVAKFFDKVINPPSFDMQTLMTVLLAMLGIGGMRTYEKIKGAHNNH